MESSYVSLVPGVILIQIIDNTFVMKEYKLSYHHLYEVIIKTGFSS